MNNLEKLRNNLNMMWNYRELLWNLAHREINQRYKQSILGYAWVILVPLVQLVVLNFLFSIVLRIPSQGVPFIIFLAVALLPWNLFANSLSSSVNSLVSNSSLITKIYFPREILVYSTILAKTVDFLFSCIVLVIFFLVYKTILPPTLLWVPLIFVIQIIFTAGLSLILAALNLFYRDIQYLLNLVVMLWMYLTPVMYPVEIVPEKYRFIFSLNPMSFIIFAYRQTILGGGQPNYSSLAIAFVMSIAVFAVGFYLFKKMEGEFADYV